jgi:hypothetical protein
MYYATIKDAKVDKFGKLDDIFPGVSFPVTGPNDDYLKEHGIEEVLQMIEHDEKKQFVVYCDPYIKDNKVYCVEAIDMTKEELAAYKAAHKEAKALSEVSDAK